MANVRFCQNNLAAAEAATLTVSSAVSGFPGSNSVDTRRWKRWRTKGAFTVTSSNKTIYINDGSNKTVTLTEATYAGGAALASHIQTQLNASSSNWTVTYSSSTYKFTFGRSSGTALLRLSQTTNAAWSMVGYVGSVDDDVGTGQAADEVRIHTSEMWHVDLGSAQEVTAFFVLSQADETFPISSSATMTLKASGTNNFTSPDQSLTLALTTDGIHAFPDLEWSDTTYRYWQFEFQDRTNSAGPEIDLCQIYLGDAVVPTSRTLNLGFERRLVDPSTRVASEGGALFWRRQTKYCEISAATVEWLADEERTELERVFREMGTTTPFFLAIDPTAAISADEGELTKYVIFDVEPTIRHLRFKYYAIDMAFREVV